MRASFILVANCNQRIPPPGHTRCPGIVRNGRSQRAAHSRKAMHSQGTNLLVCASCCCSFNFALETLFCCRRRGGSLYAHVFRALLLHSAVSHLFWVKQAGVFIFPIGVAVLHQKLQDPAERVQLLYCRGVYGRARTLGHPGAVYTTW